MPESQSSQPSKSEDEVTSPPSARLAHIGFRRFSAVEFLVALVLLFVAMPLVEDARYGKNIEASLMTVVLVSGVLAVGRSRRILIWSTVLAVPAVGGRWIHHFWPEQCSKEFVLFTALIFLVFLIGIFLRYILRAPRVNSEVLCAGISVYLLMGMSWMLAYMLVEQKGSPQHPAFAFAAGPAAGQVMSGLTAFYFSFVTLTTVGYGDITPLSNMARALAAMEAMAGTLYMAVLISRLVALHSSQGPIKSESES